MVLKHPHPYTASQNAHLDDDLYSQSCLPIFITIRAYLNYSPFNNSILCEMAIDILKEMIQKHECQLHAYCLMLDHLHYLLSPKEGGISILEFTNQYKGKTTNTSWKLGWSGKLWQPRFYDHIIRKDEDINRIGEYILQNPVRKGLVSSIEDWPWGGTTR